MPNHVTTRCIVTGPTADIRRFSSTMICVPEGDTESTLDFDRIVPMPEAVKTTSRSSDASMGIEILTGSPKPDVTSYLAKAWVQELGINSVAGLRAWAERERPRALEEGQKALNAYRETGFYDWYDWSVENWGTKWNSYWCEIEYEDDDQFSFHFDTAWNFPVPIFEKLAEMFPTLRFDCTCFDEMWNFAGEGAFNGEPPFEFVEPSDRLHEVVYGFAPVYDDETMDAEPVAD